MGLIRDLMVQPGVLAAGEYSYRGDRFSYEGNLVCLVNNAEASLKEVMRELHGVANF